MYFDLKKPCKDCPFVTGSLTNTSLPKERIEGIVSDIREGSTFTCHKTLYTDKKVPEQHCAGALIFLEKEDNPNQLMRIAERIGLYDRRKLEMDTENMIENDDY